MRITDGKGRGRDAAVNDENKLQTFAETITLFEDRIVDGEGYLTTTSFFNLSNASVENGIFYIKNNDTERVVKLSGININLGVSFSASSVNIFKDVLYRAYVNPTTGSLIAAGVTPTTTNLNFGSKQTPPVTTTSFGGLGQTIVSGTLGSTRIAQAGSNIDVATPVILGPGTSLAWSLQTPPLNTQMSASFQLLYQMVSLEELE